MPERASPSIRRRSLAAELRRLRERAGLTGDEAARRLGWSASKLSRIELHRIGVKQADLRRLLDLYRVEETHRDALLALSEESRARSLLQTVTARFPRHYAAYVHIESEAQSMWNWEPQVIPGLLQTPEYAKAVMEGYQAMFAISPGEVDRRVETRLLRQQNISRDPPLELRVVIDESVLRRRFGTRQVMREQLERLVEASDLPNVDVRILPLDCDRPFANSAFIYMKFPRVHKVPLPDLVFVEQLEGNSYIEDEEHTNMYRVAFDYVRGLSLDRAHSRTFITAIARDAWS